MSLVGGAWRPRAALERRPTRNVILACCLACNLELFGHFVIRAPASRPAPPAQNRERQRVPMALRAAKGDESRVEPCGMLSYSVGG